MGGGETREGLFRMVEELDGMERSVTSVEADLLDRMLTMLRAGREPGLKDRAKIIAMHDKYFGNDGREAAREPDEDIDPDDFE